MTEQQVAIDILTALQGSTAFVSQLSLCGTAPMLIYAPLVPEEWSITDKTANMYVSGETQQNEWERSEFTLACRAPSSVESRSLAWAARDALNRMTVNGAFVIVDIKPTIEPMDAEFDNYNTPVDIVVRYT